MATSTSSSRGRPSSSLHQRKPSSPFSSSSSSSSFKHIVPRSCSSSAATPFHGASGNGYRSVNSGLARSGSMYSKSNGYGGRSPVAFPSPDELVGETGDCVQKSGAGDRVFRPSAVTQEVYEVAARPVVKTAQPI